MNTRKATLDCVEYNQIAWYEQVKTKLKKKID